MNCQDHLYRGGDPKLTARRWFLDQCRVGHNLFPWWLLVAVILMPACSRDPGPPTGSTGGASSDDSSSLNNEAPVSTASQANPSDEARMNRAIADLQKAGAIVFVDDASPDRDVSIYFYDNLTAPTKFVDVTDALLTSLHDLRSLFHVSLHGTNVSDDQLAHLSTLPSLRNLLLSYTNVSDAGMKHLAPLQQLSILSLAGTGITDAGLAPIGEMKSLWGLDLTGAPITNDGLVHLRSLKELRDLTLSRTLVGDAGLAHLVGLQLGNLRLNGTNISDAGLAHLKSMSDLRHLELYDTLATRTGLEQLRHLENLNNFRVDGAFMGSSVPTVSNPDALALASDVQMARLEEVLWWLPIDTETVIVAHGPFSYRLPERSEVTTANQMQLTVRLAGMPDERYSALLGDQVIALYVDGSRNFRQAALPSDMAMAVFEGCKIVVFEEELGDPGTQLTRTLVQEATEVETIEECDVARFDIEESTRSAFIAIPRPNVLLIATDRDYLTTVLQRMNAHGTERALPDSLPEWSHMDRRALAWAMRHFDPTAVDDPSSPFAVGDQRAIGLVYSLRLGDTAYVRYLSDSPHAAEVVRASWPQPSGASEMSVSEVEPGVVELAFPVGVRQALDDFGYRLLNALGYNFRF